MALGFAKGLRRLLPAKPLTGRGVEHPGGLGSADGEVDTADRWEAELEEFLAADLTPLPVDAAWKRKLRDRLWRLIESRRSAASGRPAPATEVQTEPEIEA